MLAKGPGAHIDLGADGLPRQAVRYGESVKSANVAVEQSVVESTWRGRYQGHVIALASGAASELDGSRQRAFNGEGTRPAAGEH